MFRCQITNRITECYEGMTKIIVEKREKKYFNGISESVGFEPVREIQVSAKGLEIWNKMSEEQRSDLVKSLKKR